MWVTEIWLRHVVNPGARQQFKRGEPPSRTLWLYYPATQQRHVYLFREIIATDELFEEGVEAKEVVNRWTLLKREGGMNCMRVAPEEQMCSV